MKLRSPCSWEEIGESLALPGSPEGIQDGGGRLESELEGSSSSRTSVFSTMLLRTRRGPNYFPYDVCVSTKHLSSECQKQISPASPHVGS